MSAHKKTPRRFTSTSAIPRTQGQADPTSRIGGRLESTAASLRRGRTLEGLGCASEALLVYDAALAMPEATRSSFDTGRLLHRVGGCALDLGDGRRAFSSYVAAGRLGRELGMLRHCGESLAAAGWCLVAHPLATDVADAVDEDLVGAAFHGVIDEAHEVLLRDGVPNLREATVVHSRFAGLTILSSLAFLDRAPSLGAKALFHEVLTPFSKRDNVRRRNARDDARAIAFVFDALARLCDAVGDQGRQHHARNPPTAPDVAAMARFTADAFHGATRGPMRHWLGTYLRDHRAAGWATNDHLATAAGE